MRLKLTHILPIFLVGLFLSLSLSSIKVSAQDATSDLLGRINELRGSLGLHSYTLNGSLSVAAQNQAAWMAATGQISHTQSDGSTPRTRAAAAGYASSAVSENIYMGTNATAGSAWGWWLNSPIHYRGITNAAYTEVGIGASTGERGAAFVLVFGNPNGWQIPASAGGNNVNSVASAPPSFVVGVDNYGNIMHEIQEGQTLGDIALIYGYTWDDLQYIRDLNEMTEPEGRLLSIGAVLLVPPWEGTYTPTPDNGPVASAEPIGTEDLGIIEVQSTPEATVEGEQRVAAEVTPTFTPPPSPTMTLPPPPTISVVGTSEFVPDWMNQTVTPSEPTTVVVAESSPVAWQAATVTPGPTEVSITAVAAAPTDDTESGMIEPVTVQMTPLNEIETDESGDQTPPLLIVAVVLQVMILGIAGFEFLRRR